MRLPFGLASSNEVFQKRMTETFENMKGVIVMFDDILVTGKTEKEHFFYLKIQIKYTSKNYIRLAIGLKNITNCHP